MQYHGDCYQLLEVEATWWCGQYLQLLGQFQVMMATMVQQGYCQNNKLQQRGFWTAPEGGEHWATPCRPPGSWMRAGAQEFVPKADGLGEEEARRQEGGTEADNIRNSNTTQERKRRLGAAGGGAVAAGPILVHPDTAAFAKAGCASMMTVFDDDDKQGRPQPAERTMTSKADRNQRNGR
jgi:hypothetical protein